MSANPRYALAGEGGITYGIEGTQYEQASDATTDPGITNEDIDPPNPNEHTAMPHGGTGRTVFLNSPDEKDYEFDVPTTVHDSDVPFEIALGSRTETSQSAYDEIRFEEASRLPTATFRHFQADLDFVAYYIGSKASLEIEWGEGDPLQATFNVTAAQLGYDDSETPDSYEASLDPTVSPYRAHMAGDITLSEPDDGGIVKELATVSGGSLSWDNGLESQHHGGDPGRESFAVAETTGADGRYDWSLTANITDTDVYQRVYENDAPVDVEIPFVRGEADGSMTDAVIIRGERCAIVDGPMPSQAEGVLEADIGLLPESTEIEVRVPN